MPRSFESRSGSERREEEGKSRAAFHNNRLSDNIPCFLPRRHGKKCRFHASAVQSPRISSPLLSWSKRSRSKSVSKAKGGGERENRAAFSKDRWWPYDILLLRRVYVFALKLILPGSWATCPGNSIGNRSSFVFHRYLVDFRPDGEKEGEGERKKREGRERKRRKKNWDLVKGV